jgi:hypothetical protein
VVLDVLDVLDGEVAVVVVVVVGLVPVVGLVAVVVVVRVAVVRVAVGPVLAVGSAGVRRLVVVVVRVSPGTAPAADAHRREVRQHRQDRVHVGRAEVAESGVLQRSLGVLLEVSCGLRVAEQVEDEVEE